MKFSKDLEHALHQASCGVVPELDQESRGDAATVAEATMPMLDFWQPPVRPEIERLIAEGGYREFMKEAQKHVATD
jgi:hypothetical protein